MFERCRWSQLDSLNLDDFGPILQALAMPEVDGVCGRVKLFSSEWIGKVSYSVLKDLG